jgi:uncharacterized sulfatase
MDSQFGEIMQTLELAGETDNTLVLFTSEQGSQFPGCKWTNWDAGVHTALVARLPGVIRAGERTDALVQYADVAPTLIEMCGGSAEEWSLDGSSFLPVLKGEKTDHRRYVYGMHNNYPEGPSFPIRSISDGEFHYIRNLTPDEIFIEKHLMGSQGNGELNNPYWATWVWDSQTNPRTYELVKRYTRRPPEQLYRLSSDRHEMQDLALLPEYEQIKSQLSTELDKWMQIQGDPGIEQDTPESHAAAKADKHRFFPKD